MSTYLPNKLTSALQAGTSLRAALGSSELLTFRTRLSCLPWLNGSLSSGLLVEVCSYFWVASFGKTWAAELTP